MLDRTITFVLAGGVGSRLNPLTADRAKPAVPFGGQYRIIDFALTNCLHSGLRRVLVLPQYKSHSLMKHLRDGWSIFNPSLGEYITPVPPQMRTDESWYSGTANAIYQNLYLLERSGAENVVILSGDHIYRMDYAAMLRFHADSLAAVTIACMEVSVQEASSFGVMGVDEERRIVSFEEKPSEPQTLPERPDRAIVSMGVYVFSSELLVHALQEDHEDPNSSHDFGKDILPKLIETQSVYAYRFGESSGRVTADGYWRDVGSIDSYYRANMDLLDPVPPINLYQPAWPIRSANSQSPPARTVRGRFGNETELINSLIASGSIVSGGSVWNSILSHDVRVDDDAVVEESILFDGVSVGPGAYLRRCIVDKGVQVPSGERIGFNAVADSERFTVSDSGVVVIPKGYVFQERGSAQTTAIATAPCDDDRLSQRDTTKAGAKSFVD
ncbi:MAG: glucose-1-phosphate adenylyltransferase [Planctomycetes bacterium]|nr:glucose-1-phosphate adenylyltransferase [Planctomycetota bacterium]